jgi:hypothetical protein
MNGFHPFRRLAAWLLGRRVVILEDFDGELSVRVERRSYFGSPFAYRWAFGRPVWLFDEGRVSRHPSYVTKWHVLADYRRTKARGEVA